MKKTKNKKVLDMTMPDLIKHDFGWKTDKLSGELCYSEESRQKMQDGPFSYVIKTNNECYHHEFKKLNDMVKKLELEYADGRFYNFISRFKGADLTPLLESKDRVLNIIKTIAEPKND